MAEAAAHHPGQAVTLAEAKGTTELHVEPSALGITAAGWVALSMLVVVAIIIWRKVPALIGRALDARIATIRRDLDEAARLRAEAETLLASAKSRSAASAGDAQAMIAHAEAEAKALVAKAESDAADLVERRRVMAEDKIGAAERQALAEVRARAAEAAVGAAAALIAERHGADADRRLVDRAIGGLARPH